MASGEKINPTDRHRKIVYEMFQSYIVEVQKAIEGGIKLTREEIKMLMKLCLDMRDLLESFSKRGRTYGEELEEFGKFIKSLED